MTLLSMSLSMTFYLGLYDIFGLREHGVIINCTVWYRTGQLIMNHASCVIGAVWESLVQMNYLLVELNIVL